MPLMKNVALFFHEFTRKNKISMAKLQKMADVSHNTIYAYGRGEGNPTIAMIEFIAANLGVDPVLIMLGVYDPEGKQVSVLLLNTVRSVAELPREEQRRFMELFIIEMMKLWDMQ